MGVVKNQFKGHVERDVCNDFFAFCYGCFFDVGRCFPCTVFAPAPGGPCILPWVCFLLPGLHLMACHFGFMRLWIFTGRLSGSRSNGPYCIAQRPRQYGTYEPRCTNGDYQHSGLRHARFFERKLIDLSTPHVRRVAPQEAKSGARPVAGWANPTGKVMPQEPINFDPTPYAERVAHTISQPARFCSVGATVRTGKWGHPKEIALIKTLKKGRLP